MTSSIVVTPKRHFLARKHVVWAIKRPGRRIEKKRTGHYRTVKKVTKALYFTYLGEAPTEPIFTKICTVVAVPDVITCANVWAEIFRGCDFTGGRISRFPIDSFMGLTTVQRYCAACDHVSVIVNNGASLSALSILCIVRKQITWRTKQQGHDNVETALWKLMYKHIYE